jgi:hypothetical protein
MIRPESPKLQASRILSRNPVRLGSRLAHFSGNAEAWSLVNRNLISFRPRIVATAATFNRSPLIERRGRWSKIDPARSAAGLCLDPMGPRGRF